VVIWLPILFIVLGHAPTVKQVSLGLGKFAVMMPWLLIVTVVVEDEASAIVLDTVLVHEANV
jgi:hypothetical protein